MALWEKQETIVVWILAALFFIGTLVIAFFSLFHRYQRRQLMERMRLQQREHQYKDDLRLSMLEGQERERARLANDLHDALIGHLTTLQLGMELGKPKDVLIGKVGFCVKEVRRISHDLYPPMLEEKSVYEVISGAVQQWADGFEIRWRDDIRTHAGGKPQVKLHLLRVVQELLVNSNKHAQASRIDIALRLTTANLILRYADNGQGMKPDSEAGLGIKSIQNRMLMVGGSCKLMRTEGFCMLLGIPDWHHG